MWKYHPIMEEIENTCRCRRDEALVSSNDCGRSRHCLKLQENDEKCFLIFPKKGPAHDARLSHSCRERPQIDNLDFKIPFPLTRCIKSSDLNSRLVYLASSRSAKTSFINPAKYFPFTRLSVFMKTSLRMSTDYETGILPHNPDLRRLSPIGLYFALNLSKRWNVFRS